MMTVEEHSVHGGLGEATASHLMQSGAHLPFKIMGIPDEYTVAGSQKEIFDHYGISQQGIADAVFSLLKNDDENTMLVAVFFMSDDFCRMQAFGP